jgi:hypothetical protein
MNTVSVEEKSISREEIPIQKPKPVQKPKKPFTI